MNKTAIILLAFVTLTQYGCITTGTPTTAGGRSPMDSYALAEGIGLVTDVLSGFAGDYGSSVRRAGNSARRVLREADRRNSQYNQQQRAADQRYVEDPYHYPAPRGTHYEYAPAGTRRVLIVDPDTGDVLGYDHIPARQASYY